MAQSTTISTDASESPWSKLWQIPLAFAGIFVFAWGVRALALSRRPAPFPKQLAGIKALLAQKGPDAAIKQVNVVRPYYTAPGERAALHVVLGDAYYGYQKKRADLTPVNDQLAVDNYAKAIALGHHETARIDMRWGLSLLALRNRAGGLDYLQKAVRKNSGLLARLGPPIVRAWLALGKPARARQIVDRMLQMPGLPVSVHVWTLCKSIDLSLGRPDLAVAVARALAFAKHLPINALAGRLYVWAGRAQLAQGNLTAAQASLTLGRRLVLPTSADDGRAQLLLGNIAQSENHLNQAARWYRRVIAQFVSGKIMPAAWFGQGQTLAKTNQPNSTMVDDYRQAIAALKRDRVAGRQTWFLTRKAVALSLQNQFTRYAGLKRYHAALAFLRLQKSLGLPMTVASSLAKAKTEESRANVLFRQYATAGAADRAKLLDRIAVREAKAARAYRENARLATVDNMRLSRSSTWRAAELYDRAGMPKHAIAAYDRYMQNWPTAARVPQGLYRLARLRASLGQFKHALKLLNRNIRDNPQAPAAYASAVEAARCDMAESPPQWKAARRQLRGLLENNPNISPRAREFRAALFLLGRLYHRTGNFSKAIGRLREFIARYPRDRRVPRATFFLADSYRDSGLAIRAYLLKHPTDANRVRFRQAIADRLNRAEHLYARVRVLMKPPPVKGPGSTGLSAMLAQRMRRYSALYRADCLFDLKRYVDALRLYRRAAGHYRGSLLAVQANLQIVACRLAMRQTRRARAAAARAQWLLGRTPASAFDGELAPKRHFFKGVLTVLRK